jgi:hypothetical protein
MVAGVAIAPRRRRRGADRERESAGGGTGRVACTHLDDEFAWVGGGPGDDAGLRDPRMQVPLFQQIAREIIGNLIQEAISKPLD